MVKITSPVILRTKPLASGKSIALVFIDYAGKQNILTGHVMEELTKCLLAQGRDDTIAGIAIFSGKKDNFCTGADLREIIRFANPAEAHALASRGQDLLNRLRHMDKPVVFGINGICLGGGLEFALCAHKRIATDSPITTFGLPEVRLGLIPGLGGTQRLPRLVGLKASLEIILSSELVGAQRAKEIGLVDELVSPDNLLARTEEVLLELIEQSKDTDILSRLAEKTEGPIRDLEPAKQDSLFAMMERSVRIRTKGKYPAHTLVLKVMQKGIKEGIESGLAYEAETFSELASGDVSRNLISLFFASERAGQQTQQEPGQSPMTVGIVGGGTMGVSIAQLALLAGHKVVLKEVDAERLEQAVARLKASLAKYAQRTKLADAQLEELSARIAAAHSDSDFAKVQIVVEAAFESLEVKRKIFSELAKVVSDTCILTTNTSSLSIEKIAEVVPNPQRVLGMHFFHPVDKMPLVEVIAHGGTSREALLTSAAFVSALGKKAVIVKDGPGFLVNRILCCYLADAARLASKKIPMNWIEESAVSFGMPMGPFELLDEVSLDIAFTVARVVNQGCGARMETPELMDRVQAQGLLGKKSGQGFYSWDANGKRLGFSEPIQNKLDILISESKPDSETETLILNNLLFPMIDEAAHCLEEKIVTRAREVDLAMVLGIGFPAFRGGLLRYADKVGIDYVVEELEKMYTGTPRQISTLLLQMAKEGKSFYPRLSQNEAEPQAKAEAFCEQ